MYFDRGHTLHLSAGSAGDLIALAATGKQEISPVIATTHAGMPVEEFTAVVKEWLRTARHPSTGRLYAQIVYQPTLELLSYLRAKGFKTIIVSGAAMDLMRPLAQGVYEIAPEQVVG